MRRLLPLALLLLSGCAHGSPPPKGVAHSKSTLRTEFSSLVVVVEGGKIVEGRLLNRLSRSTLPHALGFSLALKGGEAGWREFVVTRTRGGRDSLTLLFRHPERPIEVEVSYEVGGEFWLKKRVRIRALRG
ncbi:MAG TPA: hypothetical protein EYP65_00745, partial [Armatimonadetes bacterium]|nr:hypothetical protein [Armatimonadota bacterium]